MAVSTKEQSTSGTDPLGTSKTPPEVIAAVREIMRQFPVVEKNVRLFPPENRVVKESMRALMRAFADYFQLRWEPICLRISETDIRFDDEPVYHDPEKGSSLAFRMYKDGVKEIRFLTDLEDQELLLFLGTFREVLTVDQDEDDFVTLLWEKDLCQIQFFAIDDFLASSTDTNDIPTPVCIDRDLRSVAGRQAVSEAPDEVKALVERASVQGEDGRVVFELDDAELARVQEYLDADAAHDPFDDFVEVVLEIVRVDSDPTRLGRTMGIIRNLIISLTERKDYDRAAVILLQLRKARSLAGLDSDLLDQTVEAIAQDDLLKRVQVYLSESNDLDAEAGIYRFLRQLPGSKAQWLCEWLALPQHTRELTSILSAVPNPRRELFVEKLSDPDGRIAKSMIVLLGKIDPKAAIEDIAKVTGHPEPEVREMATMVLAKSKDPRVSQSMLPPLTDHRRTTQRYALEYFRSVPSKSSFPIIRELVETQGGKHEDPKWLLLLMEALISCDVNGALDFFDSIVFRQSIIDRILRRNDSAHLQLAALYALGKCDDAKTLEFLERLSRSLKKELRGKATFQIRARAKRREKP